MQTDSLMTGRRALLKGALRTVWFGGILHLLPIGVWGQDPSPQQGNEPDKAEDRGSTLILLGTQGGPGVVLNRSQTASLLLVGDRQYLIDCGYGTLRALVQAGIGFSGLSNVFLTHLHNDHTSDLASLLSFKWTSGRARETDVYGSFGTAALVEGAMAFFNADAEIRIVNEGRTVRPEKLFIGHDLDLSGETEVFRDDSVVVRAVENTHFPERAKQRMPYRSFAYRFNAADRSIVFSGDTAYSDNLIQLAHNADIFVCETRGVPRPQQAGRKPKPASENGESVSRHVFETHSTTEDVGRMAAKAGVKTVVLNHLVGGGSSKGGRESFESSLVESVHKYFQGEVIVGRDQMIL